ncbi:hypothetical protein GF362_07520 [Candidatus Dojkabacteria bacterium]|nr:hypothetical protein [Candidatus Dojkabacteria bacterium]
MNKKLETLLQKNAIYQPYSNTDYFKTSIENIISAYELEFISMGTFSRVFKIKGTDWVMKEGRWDIDISIFPNVSIPIPGESTENLLRLFEVSFLPRKEEIDRQYKLYLDFIKYLGFFSNADTYYHPKANYIFELQKKIRNSLLDKFNILKKEYRFRFTKNQLKKALSNKKALEHNYVPKEYLLAGKSISEENRGKNTYYIFQEFINGECLHDVNEKELKKDQIDQLILMFYLIMLMHSELKLLPDTRPRYSLMEAVNWISNTDNIIISQDGVKFIDTRWFWETDSNIVKRGFILPDIILNQTKVYLKTLLDHAE